MMPLLLLLLVWAGGGGGCAKKLMYLECPRRRYEQECRNDSDRAAAEMGQYLAMRVDLIIRMRTRSASKVRCIYNFEESSRPPGACTASGSYYLIRYLLFNGQQVL